MSRPEPFVGDLPQEDLLALHFGRITLGAADLDRTLTRLIGVLVNRTEPNPKLAAGRLHSDKLRLLDACFPETWKNTDRLRRALKRVAEHRNELAHSTWDVDIDQLLAIKDEDLDPNDLPLQLRREKSKRATPVDFNALHLLEVDLSLLRYVCRDLWFSWLLKDIAEIDIMRHLTRCAVHADYSGWPKLPVWRVDVKRVFGDYEV